MEGRAPCSRVQRDCFTVAVCGASDGGGRIPQAQQTHTQTSPKSQSRDNECNLWQENERGQAGLYFVVVSIRQCFDQVGNGNNNKKECCDIVAV